MTRLPQQFVEHSVDPSERPSIAIGIDHGYRVIVAQPIHRYELQLVHHGPKSFSPVNDFLDVVEPVKFRQRVQFGLRHAESMP